MTNQEILDKVVNHARQQKCHAVNEKNICKYRTENGLKCFIGALIPDELYDPKMEQLFPVNIEGMDEVEISKQNLIVNNILHSIGIKQDSIPFCIEVQKIHDHDDEEQWEYSFEDIAEEFELIYTPPQVENNE